MTIPDPLPSRLIGALFVERGLISETQLAVALEMQQETGKQLGQILVERFGVPRKEVANAVAEQWAQLGHIVEDGQTAARRRLGEIFVERGFVSEAELEQALRRQQETGERLGEALVAEGVISKFELAGALAEQTYTGTDASAVEEPTDGTVVQLPMRDEPEPADDPGDAPEPPAAEPAAECVAFAATHLGYRLLPLTHTPSPGEVVELPDVGKLVVLRLGTSPLPLDDRRCAFLELPLVELAV